MIGWAGHGDGGWRTGDGTDEGKVGWEGGMQGEVTVAYRLTRVRYAQGVSKGRRRCLVKARGMRGSERVHY